LLNPYHYGTAENILLEAISAGVVPIVLNNPAEMALVEDRKNGFIVSGVKDFSDLISKLWNAEIDISKYCQNVMGTEKKCHSKVAP
jgi:glycosyltransferase involved in cell wall biosynthesis